MTHSNHVKFTVSAFLRAATGGAGAVNFQSVAGSQKPLSTRNSFDQRRDFVVVKLEKLTALAADHVVVLRVSVVMLPNFATVWTSDFPQQSGLFHCAQSPVDSRSADLLTVTTPRKSQHELICVKVLVIGKTSSRMISRSRVNFFRFVVRYSRNLSDGETVLSSAAISLKTSSGTRPGQGQTSSG
mgnify:CR=1 FL=1